MTTTFTALGLSKSALEAITAKGFEEPTEIQAKTIPLLLQSDTDVIAQAQTGTGKTATFGLVFTDKLVPGLQKSPQAIVLAPTRELALQVSEELSSLKGPKNFSIVPIYGGQSWGMQHKHLKAGVDIVVGTPGRIMDHLKKGTLKLDQVKYFVLDEADEMLNMGFIEDIETILGYAQPERQVLLFSATMPKRIANLAKKYMKDPVNIKSQKDQIAKNSIDQIYFEVSRYDKFEALCRIVDMEEDFYGIVFCRTKIACDELNKKLGDRGYKVETMHGDVPQDRRERILKNFKNKRTEILIATDVAARGIDINDLTHVINYSLPENAESYVHRIGRTGRAGREGKAITLITPTEYAKLRRFEHNAKASIQKQSIPDGGAMVELKKNKILKDLNEIMADPDSLQKFGTLAATMFKGEKPQEVIAALLKYSFASHLDESTYASLTNAKRNKPGKNARERERLTNRAGTARLFITTGHKQGANPGKILNMIDKDFGVSGRHVGQIDIMDDYSFITVPLAEAEVILDSFHAMKAQGKFAPVRVERAQHAKKDSGPQRKSKPTHKKGKGSTAARKKNKKSDSKSYEKLIRKPFKSTAKKPVKKKGWFGNK